MEYKYTFGPIHAFLNVKRYRCAFTVLLVHMRVHVRRHTTAVCSAVHRPLYWCERSFWCTRVKVLHASCAKDCGVERRVGEQIGTNGSELPLASIFRAQNHNQTMHMT